MIRVILADDEQLTRQAVAALLDLEPDLTVVAQASDAAGAVGLAAEHLPDVAVLDVEMPAGGGIVAVRGILAASPGTRCVMLTRHARPGVLRQALSAQAKGFLAKSAPASELAEVIRRVHSGFRFVDPDMAAEALSEMDSPLTEREREVLTHVDDVASTGDIAALVHLSPGTVRNYLSSAMAKLDARTRQEAARLARDSGWI